MLGGCNAHLSPLSSSLSNGLESSLCNDGAFETAFDILGEADRESGAAPHARSPQPPDLLFGDPLRRTRLRHGATCPMPSLRLTPSRRRQCDATLVTQSTDMEEATLAWLERSSAPACARLSSIPMGRGRICMSLSFPLLHATGSITGFILAEPHGRRPLSGRRTRHN